MAYLDKSENTNRKDSALTAMCASYIVCRRFGLDTSTFNFRAICSECSNADAKEMQSKLKEIRTYANRICGDMTRHLEKSLKPQTQEAR